MSGVRRVRAPQPVISLLVATALLLAAFPEVVFRGASLSPTGLNNVVDRSADPREASVYPNGGRSPRWGGRDVGAATWQLEPATKFMHRALRDGESPYWNPYSAAGSLGPETLVDIKLSPFVLAVALFGASAAAFTFTLLALLVVSLYCLQQFFTRTLGLGRLAATAACVVFLLGGFATSDLATNVGAPYVLFPVVLYTLAEFQRVGGAFRFVVAVAAYAGLITTTFLPVAVLTLLVVHSVMLLLDISRQSEFEPRGWSIANLLARQAAVPVIALAATAYVWMPMVEGLRQGGADVAAYGRRTLTTMDGVDMLGILTPGARYLREQRGEWIMYLGLVPIVLLAAAWPRSRGLQRRLLSLTVVLGAAAAMLYAGLPPLKWLGELPGFRVIRADYWGSLAATCLVLAVGVAVASAAERGLSLRGAIGAALLCGGMLVIGLASTDVSKTAIAMFLGGLALSVAVVALAFIGARVPARRRRLIAAGALTALVFELLAYQTHPRLQRFDLDDRPPSYVAFLRDEIGDDRVLNAGREGMYPEWGSAFGIPQIETETVTQLPHYREFFFEYIKPNQGRGLFLEVGSDEDAPFAADPSALNLLSVRYIIVDETMARFDRDVSAEYPMAFVDRAAGVQVYENADAFPRAYLSPVLVRDRSANAAQGFTRARTRSNDPELVEAASNAGVPTRAAGNADAGTARVTDYHHDEVRIEVEATRPAVLVLTDAYHDNWDVSVDEQPAHLGRVNDVVRGVIVPAGDSTVVFEYRSPSRALGGVISLVTIMLVVVGMAGSAWFRRSRWRATRRDATNTEWPPRPA